ncbi:hypothetical protein HII36_33285 [Nonomuraea sp. NN258]|uniref:hypothetical protein n=1 Tax=Nonomuraea antri TaxID=2730852 RepID=UPI001569FD54|nr:hypothetical protein [Nonomuraea antri]NRQ36673.1 hypothetical protein [Nonomuraea antri]
MSLVLLSFIVASVTAFVLVFKVPEWRNNEKLARLEERVSMLPLPPDTESASLGVQGTVGLQSGNSNHCDYLVRMSLETRLSESEIVRYYETVKVKGVEGRELDAQVFINPGPSWRSGYKDVIVEFFDGGHEPGYDIRCH